jgi:hypothetical protein
MILLSGCRDETVAASSSATVAPTAASAATASAPSVGATGAASGETPSGRTPPRLHITREQAREAASDPPLPDVGLALDGIWDGFTANLRPQGGTFVSLGASPKSGAAWLQFVVRGYRDADANVTGIGRLYRAWAERFDKIGTIVESPPTTVDIAGAQRTAVAFRATGGTWCVVLVPSPRSPSEGLMVMVGIAAPPDAPPDCAPGLAHERIAPLVASLRVE